MGLYNWKTTTSMLLLFSDPDSVDGETSGFGTASNHELSSGIFSNESLLLMRCILSIQKGLLIHGNLITHKGSSVTCCIHNIGHKIGIHTCTHIYERERVCECVSCVYFM